MKNEASEERMDGRRWNFGVSTPKTDGTLANKDRDYHRYRGKDKPKDHNGNTEKTAINSNKKGGTTSISTMIEPQHDGDVFYFLWSVETSIKGTKKYITRRIPNGDRVRVNITAEEAKVLKKTFEETGNNAGVDECKRLFRESGGMIEHRPRWSRFWNLIPTDECLEFISGKCAAGTARGGDK